MAVRLGVVDGSLGYVVKGSEMKNVLIVDDSAMVRRHVGNTLKTVNYNVIEAVDGEDAREKLAAAPDTLLMISDVVMPRMNGLELLSSLQQEGRYPHLNIIMLTTSSRPELIVQAKALGAKGWLIKPLKPELLLATAAKLAG